ncbi:SGNH/GDSL hydrolase family protein [Aureimonas pseudogalii]|uniref:SGNH hydrolase-type esterase domain-containing protein n=1 Tax=Aureimonas pseudogalii TaxID=1744844 RepID=A0A7W6H775_9HYPH|nr:SGNH family hydrolase [Aureimonas pseudogalii]MBB3999844.1 hypothetical protein [Aureimonas pseudogalii]
MRARTDRSHRSTRLLSLSLALALALPAALPATPAQAQQRRGILDMLFGSPRQAAPPRGYEAAPGPAPKVRKVRRKAPAAVAKRPARNAAARRAVAGSAAAAAGVAAAGIAEPVEKTLDARTVLVIGDFMAGSLGKGLEEAVAASPDLRVVSRANGSSGLVRDDHYDWPAEISAVIDETKPALVVVMLGANDRQGLRDGGETLALRTPEWATRYTARVEALATGVKDKGVPLVWVGMPAFQSDRASEDMVYLNDLYRTAALRVGGEFVDVWGGFTDADGAFTSSGPDTAGQTVRLRNSDGITLTPAGQEKLAYFVEKPVTKLLGLGADDLVATLGPQPLSPADLPSVAASAVATPPISFADPRLDGGDQLLGGVSPALAADAAQAGRRLLVEGVPAAPTEGRADHFNWTGRGGAVSAAPAAAPIVPEALRGSAGLDPTAAAAPEPAPSPAPPAN